MKNKVIALSLPLLVIGAGLASCGGPASQYDPDNFLPEGTSENPYQIVKEPVTIEVFAPHSSGNPEYADLTMFKYLSKITNLKFNFTTADTSAYNTRRSAIWQDPSYKPDLFLFNNPINEQVLFAENGFNAFVPFNDDSFTLHQGSTLVGLPGDLKVGNLINQYMPNYKKILDTNFGVDENVESAKECATLADGKMYVAISARDVARDLTYKMFINQQWIDNLNSRYDLALPNADQISTIDQYLTVLRAFKKYDANLNGDPNDEIPVSSESLLFLRNYILQSYGYVQTGMEISDDGKSFVYVPKSEAYRNYLKTMNTMWNEGLIDQTTFSIKTDAQMATKGLKGRLGSYVAAAAYIVSGMTYESQYTTVAPLNSEQYTGGKKQWGFGFFFPDGACIPQSSAYAREVARLLDIMYSDVGKQLISYGVEGENWTWDDEAHTSWTFKVPTSWTGTQEEYRATISPNVGSGSALCWSKDFVEKMNDPIIHKLNQQSSIYTQYLKVPEPAKYKFTGAEYEEIARIKANLDTQYSYYESCYVRGVDNCDPNDDASWAKFVSLLKNYGSDDLETIYNTMLKRYVA